MWRIREAGHVSRKGYLKNVLKNLSETLEAKIPKGM
jgi:hypothetical protein